MMRESKIEAYLIKRVKEMGGEVRKVQFIGHRGAPDRLVMLPRVSEIYGPPPGYPLLRSPRAARTIWVELKAADVMAEAHQLREHSRMRKMGQRVEVVDSFKRVDEVLG